jgi:hypothetical protein
LQRHWLIRTALSDQNFAAAHDERSGYETESWTGGAGVGIWLGFFHSSSVNGRKGMRAGVGAARFLRREICAE